MFNNVMFYKKGVDISNDKSMFNFLTNHYTYDTMNSWNGEISIANKVKVHWLELEGNCWTALDFLREDDYETVNSLIYDWEVDHPYYSVGFNGSSGGYLVLYNKGNCRNILPEHIAGSTYEEYKDYCLDYQGSVKNNRYELVELTKLVQDFDKLCDEIRIYVNELSKQSFESAKLEQVADDFNMIYYNDLEFCKFNELEVVDGAVDISEISQLNSLRSAFMDLLRTDDYEIEESEDHKVKLVSKY